MSEPTRPPRASASIRSNDAESSGAIGSVLALVPIDGRTAEEWAPVVAASVVATATAGRRSDRQVHRKG